MKFDYQTATNEGYSENEILDYLKTEVPNFNYDDAINEGYSVKEISDEISKGPSITPEIKHPPQVYLPKNVARPSYTEPGAPTETVEPITVIPPSKEEEQAELAGIGKARGPVETVARVGLQTLGATAISRGEKLQRKPEVDEEYEARANRGEQVVIQNQIKPEDFKYQGDVPIIPKSISSKFKPEENQDLWTYLNKWRRADLAAQGERYKQFGQKAIELGEKIQPRKYREEELSRAVTEIEQAHPGIATSFKEGDVSGALDGLLFDASLSGNDEAIKNAMELKRRFGMAAGKIEEESKGENVFSNVLNSTAEMLPMMGKGVVLNAIPVAGQILSTSMWARQGAGQVLEDMYKAGIPKDVALPIALNAGIAYSLVEQLQVGQVMRSGVKDAIGKPLVKKLVDVVKEKGIDWAKENVEEIAQSIIQEKAFRDATDAANIDVNASGIRKTYSQLVGDTFKQSAGPLGLLSLLGLGAGAGKIITQPKEEVSYAEGVGREVEKTGEQTQGLEQKEEERLRLRNYERVGMGPEYAEEIEVKGPEYRDRIAAFVDRLAVVKNKKEREGIIERIAPEEAQDILTKAKEKLVNDQEKVNEIEIGLKEKIKKQAEEIQRQYEERKRLGKKGRKKETIEEKTQPPIETKLPETKIEEAKIRIPKIEIEKIPSEEIEEISQYGREGKLLGGRIFKGGVIPPIEKKQHFFEPEKKGVIHEEKGRQEQTETLLGKEVPKEKAAPSLTPPVQQKHENIQLEKNGDIFKEITLEKIINTNREQRPFVINKLFGDIPENRMEELDDGAKFKNKEEEVYYDLANKYQADIEYAAKQGSDIEVKELYDAYHKEFIERLSPSTRKPIRSETGVSSKISSVDRIKLKNVKNVSIIHSGAKDNIITIQSKDGDREEKIEWNEDAIANIIGPVLAKEIMTGRFINRYSSKIMAGKEIHEINHNEIKQLLSGKLKSYENEIKERETIRFAKQEKPSEKTSHLQAQDKRSESLIREIYKVSNSKSDPVLTSIRFVDDPGPTQEALQRIVEKVTKQKVHLIESDEQQLRKDLGFAIDGLSRKGEIYIDVGTQRPLLWTAFHEFYHGLNRVHKDSIIRAARLTDEGMAKQLEEGREEFIADIIGEMASRQEFWDNLAAESPSRFKAIVQELIDAINKVIVLLRKLIISDKANKPEYDKYLKDSRSVRDTLVEVLKAKNTTEETKKFTETIKPEAVTLEEKTRFAKRKEPPTEGFKKEQVNEYLNSPLSLKYHTVKKEDLPNIYEEAKTSNKKKTSKEIKKVYKNRKESAGLIKWMTRTTSGRLLEISPVIRDQLQKHVNGIMIDTTKAAKKIQPFLKALNKMPQSDYAVFDIAAKNAQSEKIEELAKKYGFEKELKSYRDTFDNIILRLINAGYETGYLKDYFPRMSKDRDVYRNYIRGTPEWGDIDEAIKEKNKKLGREMTDDELDEFLDLYIRGYGDRLNAAKPGNLKERKVMYIDNKANSLLEDTIVAVPLYVERMIKKAARKELFDPDAKKTELEVNNIDESIGNYVAELVKKHKLNVNQQDQLVGLIKSYFNYKPTDKTLATIKNIGFVASMGSGFSTMFSQMADIAWSLYTAPKETVGSVAKSLFNKTDITLQDLGIDSILGEFRDPGKLSAFMDKLFKGVGIKWGDSLFKNAFIQANLEKYRRMAKSEKTNVDFINDLQNIFGDEADAVVNDLKNNVDSDNVKLLMLNQMSKFIPVTLLQVPQMYLDRPGMRIVYGLKTYQFAQINAIFDEAIRGMNAASNVPDFKEAAARFFGIIGILIACGITTDKLKDFLFRRKCTWGQYVVDNIFKLAFISRYTLWRVRTDGIQSALWSLIAPPISWLDYIAKDVRKGYMMASKGGKIRISEKVTPDDFIIKDLETLRITPFVGQEYYWWMGGGRESQLKKEKYHEITKELKRDIERQRQIIKNYSIAGDVKNAEVAAKKLNDMVIEKGPKVQEYLKEEKQKEYPKKFKRIGELLKSKSKIDNAKAKIKIKNFNSSDKLLFAQYQKENKEIK